VAAQPTWKPNDAPSILPVAAQAPSAALRAYATRRCQVKLGERTIGFLQTGRVALEVPSAAGFEAIARQLTDWGAPVDLKNLEDAYYRSRVLSQDQYAGFIRLLEIFARQLWIMANRIMVQDAETEPPMIRRARAYIAGHYGDPVDLDEIARVMHVCEHLLLLQNVQEDYGPDLHRLSRARPSGEG